MRHRQLIFTAAVGLAAILVAGCASAPAATSTQAPKKTSVPTDTPEQLLETTVDFASELEDFDPSNFDNPTNIDNPWLPLKPGMQYIYEGVTEEGGETTEHLVKITITDLTKEIDGVTALVTWDEDYSGGDLVETELAFYAQDNDGNVWRMGEYPEVYENNKLIEAPAWISGLKGARAGIMMSADPQLGGRSYSQGWGPAVGFTDRWQVDNVGQETCVPVECYDGVLVTAEYSEAEPDAFQLKFYAADVGNVRVGWKGLDATREELVLAELVQLSPSDLAEAREQALQLEARAYEISKEVYDQTPPSVVLSEAAASELMMEGEEPLKVFEDFDPSNFDDPTNIDNPWLPLKPGMQYIYEGVTEEGGETTEHLVIITVTDLTKEIDGVTALVTWDEDYSGGDLVETELAFYAQDNDGNVWRMGEYPEVYENNKLIEAPAWISGLKGARAGIMMSADPQLGGRSYSQGWGPAVGFTDRWQVDNVGQETCVPVECYDGVLVTAEYSEAEPDAFQLKFYAADVGNVRVGWKGLDATREELVLAELVQLSPSDLAEAREQALQLEARAYETSKEVYDQTPPSLMLSEAAASELMMGGEEPLKVFEDFDPSNFDNPTIIYNGWLPLRPGTQWIYWGATVEGEEEIPHRIEFTVTDLTKEIDGIETVVAYVVDINNDQLVEAEIAFYAQDNDGNVWFFGEYPEEYEDGELVGAPAWLHGREEASAGIKMMADPQLGTPGYFQGWGPAVEWTDYGQVDQMDQETCVPFGCYDGVLVIAESSLEEVDAYQLKFYAYNVGNIRVGWRGADATQEELALVEFIHLRPETLAEIRALALELEASAYENAGEVFTGTPPSQGP